MSVREVTRSFGAARAVNAVSFELTHGEVFGLLGPNGSGKTTLLRMLTGYLRPDSGTLRIGGYDVVADGERSRALIGYVPEDGPSFRHQRVVEFLQLMARVKGLDADESRREVARVAATLALQSVMNRVIGGLSRGFRQRVAIAQALLGAPPLLILDEPTNGLDPRQIIECRRTLRSLAGQHTVMITSHILGEIEKLADRAAILLRGELLSIETLRGPNPTTTDLESRFLELTDSADP